VHITEPYAELHLPGNHTVKIYDHSKSYFGDYCRVCLEVKCEIPLPTLPGANGEPTGYSPDVAVYSRILEKMAVPSAEVESVRQALIAEFRRNSLPYLATPDFPARLIAKTVALQTAAKMRFSASR